MKLEDAEIVVDQLVNANNKQDDNGPGIVPDAALRIATLAVLIDIAYSLRCLATELESLKMSARKKESAE